jgi:hypothetical protein
MLNVVISGAHGNFSIFYPSKIICNNISKCPAIPPPGGTIIFRYTGDRTCAVTMHISESFSCRKMRLSVPSRKEEEGEQTGERCEDERALRRLRRFRPPAHDGRGMLRLRRFCVFSILAHTVPSLSLPEQGRGNPSASSPPSLLSPCPQDAARGIGR